MHRCSKSYKERYLDSYVGHTGPVYKIRCNPFNPDVFLTASADWSCRIWNSKYEEPLLSLKSLDLMDEVYDVQWNPFSSTSFANVCKDGRLELWDISKKNFDPLYCFNDQSHTARNCLVFSEMNPVIMTGDIKGTIQVFRHYGYEKSHVDTVQEMKLLNKTLNLEKIESFEKEGKH